MASVHSFPSRQRALAELLGRSAEDIRDVCLRVSEASGWPAAIVEKDLWVTWALWVLFNPLNALTMQDRPIRLAFKGGTSLSKAYRAIHRFSEDIDLTLHFEDLGVLDQPLAELSRKQADRARKALDGRAADVARDQVVPMLRRHMDLLNPDGEWRIDLDPDDPLSVVVSYPRHQPQGTYLLEGIKLEFGGRNVAEPFDTMSLATVVHEHFPGVGAPQANCVRVLAGEYTFWEKVTLAHAELLRPSFANRIERMSRHWYDLWALSSHDLGRSALQDKRALLNGVIQMKSVLYRQGTVNYRDVAEGRCSIVPVEADVSMALRSDYESMESGGMLGGQPPTWENVLEAVRRLQARING